MTLDTAKQDRASQASELLKSLNLNSSLGATKKIVKKKPGNFSSEIADIANKKAILKNCGVVNPYFRAASSVSNDQIVIDDKSYINFSGYNYLGFSGEERVNQAAKDAIDNFGTSPSASRLVSGEKTVHLDLEKSIADFLDCEASVVFPSGHATNVTVIGHLFNTEDLILYDELSHNSIIEGAVLSGARRIAFKHNKIDECENYIKKFADKYKRIVVITEGVYSMDGDIAPLDKLVALKKKYGLILYVDEAHSLGTIGENGGGAREHFGLKGSDVDLWMGTLSKTLSSNGGYIAGAKDVIEFLRYTTPGFVFTAGTTPANSAAALESIAMLKEDNSRVQRLIRNSAYFCDKLKKAELDVGLSEGTPIVPLIVRESKKSILLSDLLYKNGIISHPMFYPTVPEGEARLRFFITSEQTLEQLDYVVETIVTCYKTI